MSDLTGKFGGFEDQIAGNHTEVMNALDTIATALGAPPPGPTTTLADVVTALTQTNTTLAGIRTDMNTKLDYIFNTLDAMNNNASLNAQRILALMLQTSCPCDTTAPLLPPDLGTTPIDATLSAKCQRIQYFIDLFRTWVINVGQYVGSQGSISSFQINNLMQSQLADRSITTGQLANGMPTSTRDQIVSLLSSAVGSVGASTVDSELFNAMITANIEALRQALYDTDNASDGKTAFDDTLNIISMTDWARTILVAMFYSSWPNDIYSDTPIVDASAYDGTICVTQECVTLFDDTISPGTQGPFDVTGYGYFELTATGEVGPFGGTGYLIIDGTTVINQTVAPTNEPATWTGTGTSATIGNYRFDHPTGDMHLLFVACNEAP